MKSRPWKEQSSPRDQFSCSRDQFSSLSLLHQPLLRPASQEGCTSGAKRESGCLLGGDKQSGKVLGHGERLGCAAREPGTEGQSLGQHPKERPSQVGRAERLVIYHPPAREGPAGSDPTKAQEPLWGSETILSKCPLTRGCLNAQLGAPQASLLSLSPGLSVPPTGQALPTRSGSSGFPARAQAVLGARMAGRAVFAQRGRCGPSPQSSVCQGSTHWCRHL